MSTAAKSTTGVRSHGTTIEFKDMPGHLIRRMHQLSQAVFNSAVSDAGIDLTSVQFAALSAIRSEPGMDQATLASRIAFDRATTGGVIDRLESKGFVRREVAKHDRRMRRLYVEDAGSEVLSEVYPIVWDAQREMLKSLSSTEHQTFLRLLEKALGGFSSV